MRQYSDGNPLTGVNIAIFDQYLALGSMTAGASSVVNNFDRVIKFITADADNDLRASVSLVYDALDVVFISQWQAEENRTEFVCINKLEAKVTNNKRRHSRFSTVETNYRWTRSIARPVCDGRATC